MYKLNVQMHYPSELSVCYTLVRFTPKFQFVTFTFSHDYFCIFIHYSVYLLNEYTFINILSECLFCQQTNIFLIHTYVFILTLCFIRAKKCFTFCQQITYFAIKMSKY
jgi:hypothetical protein